MVEIATQQQSIVDLIGNTPLLRLAHLPQLHGIAPGVEIYAKAEWFNPGGSVKDRAAWSMVRDGMQRGLLGPGKTLIDATSGNTGIAYAMIGAALGFKVKLCMPSNASLERKRILRAYGAELLLTDPRNGTDGAQREAKRIVAADPDRYYYPDQYNNPANWQAHYNGTAPEIWAQTAGRITHFVSVLGTSGTFVGSARRLRELNPAIHIAAVQPDSPMHGLEGMKHMATALVPGIYDPALADEQLTAETEPSQAMVRALARHEGWLVGPSGGAAVLVALRVAQRLSSGVVVTVLPDGGSRYLSEGFWDAEE